MNRARAGGTVAAALLSFLIAGAAPGQDAPRFEGSVEIVAVDANVVDGKGEPLRDLTAEEFVVKVDGRPRRVLSAEFVENFPDYLENGGLAKLASNDVPDKTELLITASLKGGSRHGLDHAPDRGPPRRSGRAGSRKRAQSARCPSTHCRRPWPGRLACGVALASRPASCSCEARRRPAAPRTASPAAPTAGGGAAMGAGERGSGPSGWGQARSTVCLAAARGRQRLRRHPPSAAPTSG